MWKDDGKRAASLKIYHFVVPKVLRESRVSVERFPEKIPKVLRESRVSVERLPQKIPKVLRESGLCGTSPTDEPKGSQGESSL